MVDAAAILAASVLIVDDLDANVQLLARMLGSAGYTSVTATMDPRAVCELHRKHRYDLILLDLQMPGMDGFQVMEGLREITPDGYLPVLVITAQPGHKLRALRAGATDFISKPFELAEVLARVHNMLEVRLLHKRLHDYNDVLEQRMRERSAATAESARLARYNQTVLDSTGEGLFGVDRHGAFTFLNATAGRLLGLDPEAACGRSMHDLIHTQWRDGSALPAHRDRILAAAMRGRVSPRSDGEVFVRGDGTAFEVEYTASPLQDDAGEGGAVVAFNDITIRKETERQLLAAKAEAELANVAKSQFLANMSHELRTPLNAVILYSELLKEEASETGRADLVDDLEKIRGAGRHLLALVNGVLDLSKVEAGKMELYLETFDVETMANEVVMTVMPVCRKRGTRLTVECAPDVGSICADITKVRQILFNLLSNACKFTAHGVITLSVTRTADRGGDDASELIFRVADSGIGMTSAELGRLFQPFVQADASTTRRFGGTGLGLAISKRFAELMLGSITVESTPGVGSTFTLTLPLEDAAGIMTEPVERDEAEPLARRVPAADKTVLVVEDDELTRDILGRALTKQGWSVVKAADGRAALALLAEHPVGLLLLDLMMPEMDGFELLDELRQVPEWRSIPVIVLTAKDLTPGERARLSAQVEKVQMKGASSREALLKEVTDLVRAVAEQRRTIL